MKNKKIQVVIRFMPIFGGWFICFAKTYLTAFRRDFNGYQTREEAVKVAEENNLEVVFHKHDPLQQTEQNKTEEKTA